MVDMSTVLNKVTAFETLTCISTHYVSAWKKNHEDDRLMARIG